MLPNKHFAKYKIAEWLGGPWKYRIKRTKKAPSRIPQYKVTFWAYNCGEYAYFFRERIY